MLVQDGLQNNALRRPEKTALVCGGRRLTYAEVDAAADRLANALMDKGISRGDRVVVFLPNSVEAVVGIYAILKAGATFVVLHHTTKPHKLRYILGNCQAAAMLLEGRTAADDAVAKVCDGSEHLKALVLAGPGEERVADARAVAYGRVQRDYPAARPRIANIDLDLACLVYTSGSTGDPKGVMCDHSNATFAANSIITYLENTESDIVINVLPLSFDYGLYQLLMTFTFGGTLVLEDTFAFPAVTLRRIAEERVTGFPGVPTVFASLLQMDLGRFDLSTLRYVSNTAAALPASHIQEIRRRLPGVTVYSMYGLTETKRTLYLPPDRLDTHPGSVGIAIPGTEVWIEGPDGARLGPHQVGQLVVRGRHVMRGYWQAPEATAARFRSGPLPGERLCYTGDLFRCDEQGNMYFVGRTDDIIKTRGEKVAPKEVEAVLHSLPGVVEAAVSGVPDPILGEAIKATLVADESRVTKSAVLAHCRAHLEEYMIPKYVEFRAELPKTTSGKVMRRGL